LIIFKKNKIFLFKKNKKKSQITRTLRNSFIFNENLCMGCNACVVACNLENSQLQTKNWRTVNTFNKNKISGLPLVHLSLACNHCDSAPCMKNCPAKAYSRNEETGAVIHDAKKCIGCKYCTWVCPFDAPVYSMQKGVVEKCTFCTSRISEGKKTACATLCPTGALDFRKIDEDAEIVKTSGLLETTFFPKIKIIKKRTDTFFATNAPQKTEVELIKELETKNNFMEKIDIRKEWTLGLFTVLITFLGGLFVSTFLQERELNSIVFSIISIPLIVLSSLHLGRKEKAWRAIINLRNSWLSREIFFFSSFVGFGFIFLQFNEIELFGWLAIVSALLCFISVDMVYSPKAIQPIQLIHSSLVTFSAIFFIAFFLKIWELVSLIIFLKMMLYFSRKLKFTFLKKKNNYLVTICKITFSLIIPIILWIYNPAFGYYYLATSFLIGEIIDRMEFYNELRVITPQILQNEAIETH